MFHFVSFFFLNCLIMLYFWKLCFDNHRWSVNTFIYIYHIATFNYDANLVCIFTFVCLMSYFCYYFYYRFCFHVFSIRCFFLYFVVVLVMFAAVIYRNSAFPIFFLFVCIGCFSGIFYLIQLNSCNSNSYNSKNQKKFFGSFRIY